MARRSPPFFITPAPLAPWRGDGALARREPARYTGGEVTMPRSASSRAHLSARVSPETAAALRALPVGPGPILQALIERHLTDPLVLARAEEIAASDARPGRRAGS